MRICPKCGAYYADAQLAFCLADGTPLADVDPGSEKWKEAARAIEEKASQLRKHKRGVKWRRVVFTLATVLIATMVMSRSFSVETTPAPVYKISGQVRDAGAPGVAIKITLNGAKIASTTTDAQGNYSFDGLPAGVGYTISPASDDKIPFTPLSRAIASLTQDESADFDRQVQTDVYKISGRVTAASKAVGGVKLTLAGARADYTTTDPNGNYAFVGLKAGGNYTVAAVTNAKMSFTPPSRVFDNLAQDGSVDFVAEPVAYKISGRVADAKGPLAGINVELKGAKKASTTTDAHGNYTFKDLPAARAYVVTPSSKKMDFTPLRFSTGNLAQDERAPFTGADKHDETAACTETDKRREVKTLDDIWRRKILAGKVIITNAPGVVGNLDSIRIEAITVSESCTGAEVVISYPEQVVEGPDARQKKIIRARKSFRCNRSKGTWTCP